MLAALLNVPSTPEEWAAWSWHHRLSHQAIFAATLSQKKVGLTDYVIDPITLTQDWLQRNQELHLDMDAALGSQSVDLTDVDFNDPKQIQSWIFLHYIEHQTAEQRLGIGS
jgi:hypothetical protein